jgi:hypothetical protein
MARFCVEPGPQRVRESQSTYLPWRALLRNDFRQEGKIWLRIRVRFPAQPPKAFPDGRFAEAQPPRNPSITHPLGFKAEDGLVSLRGFLVPGRPSPRARESAQPTGLKALLVAPQRSDGVAEAACDVVLICVSRLEKQDHGVGLGGAIVDGVVRKNDAMDSNHSLVFLGLNTNAIVDEDGTGRSSWVGKELLLKWSRTHLFLSPTATDRKSGPF